MNTMNRHSQQGLTTISWIVVIGIFAMVVVTAFKVLPMYLEYYQIRSTMDAVATDEVVDVHSKRDLWLTFSKRFQVNQIVNIKRENMTFTQKGGKTQITIDYEVRKPYIAQLFIGGHFTYTVEK